MNKRAQLYKYKGNRCCSCGLSIHEMVERYGTFERMFELHHIDPAKKADNYNNLIKQKLSSEQLEEVDKCVLLCSVCHGLVHAQNIKAKVTITIDYEERSLSQDLNGWLIVDMVDNSKKFFSEERLLLTRYLEKLNDAEPIVIFGIDLKDGLRYKDMVASLKKGDVYQIFHAETGDLMLQAKSTDTGLELDINVKFGFIDIDASKAPKGSRFWYRNGYRLLENGEVETEGIFKFRSKKPLNADA
jgi:hypothetical protein